jgi:hypothetical protein
MKSILLTLTQPSNPDHVVPVMAFTVLPDDYSRIETYLKRDDHAAVRQVVEEAMGKRWVAPGEFVREDGTCGGNIDQVAMQKLIDDGWSVETIDPIPTTPHNVTIDIYGEEFHFKASADEARRLIKTFERVLAARKDVTRLKRELAGAEAKSFVSVGVGEGIVVDDPDGVEPEAA